MRRAFEATSIWHLSGGGEFVFRADRQVAMLLELLILLTSGGLLALVVIVLVKLVSCRLALIRFNKLSRGLPILPGGRLLGNHAHNVFFGDRVCQKLQRCHQELGPTIGWLRNGDFSVSTVDLDLIKTFIVDEPQDHLERTTVNMPIREIGDSIIVKRVAEWRPLRRAVATALLPYRFKTPNVQQEIERSIEKLLEFIKFRLESGEPDSNLFSADDFLARYSADLVFSCFYKQPDLIDFESKRDENVDGIEQAMFTYKDHPAALLSSIFPQLISVIEHLAMEFTLIGTIVRKYHTFIEKQIRLTLAARKQWPELKKEADKAGISIDPQNFELRDGTRYKRNMADYIIDQYIDGKIAKEDLINSSFFFILAGYRTAADCLIHTSYLLSIDQDAQDKLRESIVTSGTDSEYLEWVLLESLRLLPPAPIGCSRTVTRDIELASGHVVPKGTFVHTNAYVIHRLKEYWGEDAEEFRPDRWRDTSHHHPMQFQAFGAGLRNCPGRQFAMHEMKMLLVALLTRYKITGEPRPDAYEFDASLFTFIIPSSLTQIRLRPLSSL